MPNLVRFRTDQHSTAASANRTRNHQRLATPIKYTMSHLCAVKAQGTPSPSRQNYVLNGTSSVGPSSVMCVAFGEMNTGAFGDVLGKTNKAQVWTSWASLQGQ
eukprot:EG_transcript_23878